MPSLVEPPTFDHSQLTQDLEGTLRRVFDYFNSREFALTPDISIPLLVLSSIGFVNAKIGEARLGLTASDFCEILGLEYKTLQTGIIEGMTSVHNEFYVTLDGNNEPRKPDLDDIAWPHLGVKLFEDMKYIPKSFFTGAAYAGTWDISKFRQLAQRLYANDREEIAIGKFFFVEQEALEAGIISRRDLMTRPHSKAQISRLVRRGILGVNWDKRRDKVRVLIKPGSSTSDNMGHICVAREAYITFREADRDYAKAAARSAILGSVVADLMDGLRNFVDQRSLGSYDRTMAADILGYCEAQDEQLITPEQIARVIYASISDRSPRIMGSSSSRFLLQRDPDSGTTLVEDYLDFATSDDLVPARMRPGCLHGNARFYRSASTRLTELRKYAA